jgi:hypothetical protein
MDDPKFLKDEEDNVSLKSKNSSPQKWFSSFVRITSKRTLSSETHSLIVHDPSFFQPKQTFSQKYCRPCSKLKNKLGWIGMLETFAWCFYIVNTLFLADDTTNDINILFIAAFILFGLELVLRHGFKWFFRCINFWRPNLDFILNATSNFILILVYMFNLFLLFLALTKMPLGEN